MNVKSLILNTQKRFYARRLKPPSFDPANIEIKYSLPENHSGLLDNESKVFEIPTYFEKRHASIKKEAIRKNQHYSELIKNNPQLLDIHNKFKNNVYGNLYTFTVLIIDFGSL
ncbi:hypothetical protein BB560_003854 [Smittium megazygosporum]|uniref:Uncharacterized protein n=1 Tax=Smittium megazygosporum TaxID=133381 RepID=A0A2T9Y966_9FUNG|nr:hypothetical protein BB560_006333 [Smittium megazygosporum]PVV01716.1 hypothetical protein BB560_003854 [Smittium megazygosporum]